MLLGRMPLQISSLWFLQIALSREACLRNKCGWSIRLRNETLLLLPVEKSGEGFTRGDGGRVFRAERLLANGQGPLIEASSVLVVAPPLTEPGQMSKGSAQ